jgi:hypothetical protein
MTPGPHNLRGDDASLCRHVRDQVLKGAISTIGGQHRFRQARVCIPFERRFQWQGSPRQRFSLRASSLKSNPVRGYTADDPKCL